MQSISMMRIIRRPRVIGRRSVGMPMRSGILLSPSSVLILITSWRLLYRTILIALPVRIFRYRLIAIARRLIVIW